VDELVSYYLRCVGYTSQDERMTVNQELKTMSVEASLAYFKVSFQISPGGTEVTSSVLSDSGMRMERVTS
jgi:hypothetical protein